jgi:hypothetical protein
MTERRIMMPKGVPEGWAFHHASVGVVHDPAMMVEFLREAFEANENSSRSVLRC